MENPPVYAIESVDNALRLLLMLRRDGSMRVSSAAAELDVARSTAHRLLAMLKYRGFVVQDAEHRYLPGPALRSLGGETAGIALPGLARTHMQALSTKLGETVNLVIRNGDQIRFIEGIEGTALLRIGSRTGVTLPAERTSGGKVLLADLPRAEVEDLYSRWESGTAELKQLNKQLSLTRRRGYGTNFEETEAGVLAIAVGIRDVEATAIAALTVAVPTVRYSRAQIADLLPALRATAERIRREIIGG